MKYTIKEIIIAIFLSYFVVTILNILVSKLFPQIPIFKSGVALILIMIAVLVVLLFTLASDGNFSKEDMQMTLLIIAIMVGIYFVVKHFIPGLFSIFPDETKQIFDSIVG